MRESCDAAEMHEVVTFREIREKDAKIISMDFRQESCN